MTGQGCERGSVAGNDALSGSSLDKSFSRCYQAPYYFYYKRHFHPLCSMPLSLKSATAL